MRLRRSIAVVAAVVLAFALGYATRRGGERPAPAAVAAPQPVLADAVRQVLAQRYVKALDPGALASARTVPQLIAQLRDPFTSYLTSSEYAALKADTVQGFYGIGVRVRAQGKSLRLMMKRDGGKAHVVAVRRGIVRQPSVIVQDRGAVRVIRITRFSHGVAKDVRRYARHAPVVVLDLRGNPGGLISEAIDTVDVFLQHGRILSYSGAHMLGQVVSAKHSA